MSEKSIDTIEIRKWLNSKNYQTDQGEQEYIMYFSLDMPKILEEYHQWRLENES